MTAELLSEPRFRSGIAEFNAGNYFEAHEVWEDLWLELIGAEKSLVQGLIQIAAGYYKFTQGNRSATRKLFEKALVRIKALAARHEAWLAEFVGSKRRTALVDLLKDFG